MRHFWVSVKRLLFLLNDTLGVFSFLLHGRRPKEGLTILCYHRLAKGLPDNSPFNAYNVDPDDFSRQLEDLGRMNEISLISARELAGWMDAGPPASGAYLMITFDDGWHHGLAAATQLATKGWRATFYVPTAHLGSKFFSFSAYDTWCSAQPGADPRCYTPLTVEDCVELRKLGMEVQPHGHSHRSLGNLPTTEMEAEVRDSVAFVRQRLGTEVLGYCYPFGSSDFQDFTDKVIGVLRSSGIRFALSTDAGCNRLTDLRENAHRLKRVPVNDYDRGLFFQAKASGYCGILPFLKKALHTSQRVMER